MRIFFVTACIGACIFCLNPSYAEAFVSVDSTDTVTMQREAYKKARRAVFDGNFAEALKLKEGLLKDYPLNVWLDYYTLRKIADPSAFYEVSKFIEKAEHRVLSELLTDTYIEVMAEHGRYDEVLQLMPKLPYDPNAALNNSQRAKVCRFYEASWALGKADDAAVAFSQKLYLNLAARPAGCNGLIALFETKGYLTDRLKLEKFERAFIEQQRAETTRSLVNELNNTQYQDLVTAAMNCYEDPLKCVLDKADSDLAKNAAILAFKRLAKIDSKKAMELLPRFEAAIKPSGVQQIGIYQVLAGQNLGRLRSYEDAMWVDNNLPEVAWTSTIKEQRLRKAVYFGQWQIVYELLDRVDPAMAGEINWRYWKGRAALELGFERLGHEILFEVAKDRSFFGFLAAQTLKVPYAYNHLKLSRNNSLDERINADPAVRRFMELEAMDDKNAIIEWREIARFSDEDVALAMADRALSQGRVDYAIESVIASKRWDALDYRFPVIYTDIYEHNSAEQNVPLSFLYAISRQESMLNPVVKSPAGAVGLMQLMPATARMVSKQNRWNFSGVNSLRNPEINVRLGAAYIRNMLDKFGGNRILAAAAYNAGPSRIGVWQSKDGRARDAAMYIESIPFLETRKYVQNVLLYDVIYNKLINGTDQDLLTQNELNFRY